MITGWVVVLIVVVFYGSWQWFKLIRTKDEKAHAGKIVLDGTIKILLKAFLIYLILATIIALFFYFINRS